MYLLDTNVISELRKVKQGRANENVVQWLQSVSPTTFYTNAVVMMELQRDILRKAGKDPAQAQHLENWYQTAVKMLFDGRILPIDEITAEICATLHIPDRAPENDAWIASTAIQHDLTLVTRNVRDFQHPHLRVLNPFDEKI